MDDPLTPERCQRSAILLSLDMAAPLYEQMGLLLPEPVKPAVMTELREIIQESGGASRAIAVAPDFADKTLQRLASRFGPEIRDRYLRWVLDTYEESPSDHPHTAAWSTVLTWSAALPSRWDLLQLPKTLSRDARLRIAAATDWDEIDSLMMRSIGSIVSPWDSRTINDRRFDDGPWDVKLAIGSNIHRQRFRAALDRLTRQLSDEEQASFHAAVSDVGRDNELTDIEQLRPPADLREPAVD